MTRVLIVVVQERKTPSTKLSSRFTNKPRSDIDWLLTVGEGHSPHLPSGIHTQAGGGGGQHREARGGGGM